MIEFVVGVAVGAAFAPFWIKAWDWFSDLPPVRKLIYKIKDFFTSVS